MKLDIQDSFCIKGVAILLMFVHHLFMFQQRIIEPSQLISLVGSLKFEFYIGYFAQICVSLFLFVSGYGLSLSSLSAAKIFSRLIKFFGIYWYYFFIFVPIGFFLYPDVKIFGSDKYRYVDDFSVLIKNLSFFLTTYNPEWWFGRLYVELLIFSVALAYVKNYSLLVVCISILTSAVFTFSSFGSQFFYFDEFMVWQLPFVLGFFYSKIPNATCFNKWMRGVAYIKNRYTVLFFCGLLFVLFRQYGLMLAAPCFIYALLSFSMIKASRLLYVLGRYSFPMWLIHSFFCYYFWQSVIYAPKISVLVFLNLTIVVFLVAVILEYIRNLFVKHGYFCWRLINSGEV